MSVSIKGLVGCCGSASWDDKVCVSETFETCAVVGVEGVFVWSLVILSAGVSVGIASVILDEWFEVVEIVICATDELGKCWLNIWLVPSGNEGDIICREASFLRVIGKCLKSFNFGILICDSVSSLWGRKKCLLTRKAMTIKDDFEIVLYLFCPLTKCIVFVNVRRLLNMISNGKVRQ